MYDVLNDAANEFTIGPDKFLMLLREKRSADDAMHVNYEIEEYTRARQLKQDFDLNQFLKQQTRYEIEDQDYEADKTTLSIAYQRNGLPGTFRKCISIASKVDLPIFFSLECVPCVAEDQDIWFTYSNTQIHLRVIDTAGEEDFHNLRPLTYPRTDVFILCFSLVHPLTFENIEEKWYPEIKHYCPNAVTVLVGTNLELRDDTGKVSNLEKLQRKPISFQQGCSMQKRIQAQSYIECSAATMKNVKILFEEIVPAAIMKSQENFSSIWPKGFFKDADKFVSYGINGQMLLSAIDDESLQNDLNQFLPLASKAVFYQQFRGDFNSPFPNDQFIEGEYKNLSSCALLADNSQHVNLYSRIQQWIDDLPNANELSDNDLSTQSKNLKSDEINLSIIENNDEDILAKQQRLKEEAKVALVLGAKMARMQVQIERRALKKKKSPLYDIIGINTNDDKPLTLRMLEDMNICQLQVIVNDLHCQIEDSILVDIEDLTKRLQERAASLSPESKRTSTNGAAQRIYIVKSSTTQQQDVQKKSILHNLLRKATFT
ncbi:unnamed protein product [Rotaria sordida]|uniref:Schwannomin interacting protein 1 C-terminal domain-containing protein n=3 Tax=Rotaria sordida TaxID=392033 RepID=A0A815I4R0_9BILA|nr:unnamed protein product [Rotaria sordida]